MYHRPTRSRLVARNRVQAAAATAQACNLPKDVLQVTGLLKESKKHVAPFSGDKILEDEPPPPYARVDPKSSHAGNRLRKCFRAWKAIHHHIHRLMMAMAVSDELACRLHLMQGFRQLRSRLVLVSSIGDTPALRTARINALSGRSAIAITSSKCQAEDRMNIIAAHPDLLQSCLVAWRDLAQDNKRARSVRLRQEDKERSDRIAKAIAKFGGGQKICGIEKQSAAPLPAVSSGTSFQDRHRERLAEAQRRRKARHHAEAAQGQEARAALAISEEREYRLAEAERVSKKAIEAKLQRAVMHRQSAAANIHYEKSLLLYQGWRPWIKYVRIGKMMCRKADQHRHLFMFRRGFTILHNHRQSVCIQRRHEVLKRTVWRAWMEHRARVRQAELSVRQVAYLHLIGSVWATWQLRMSRATAARTHLEYKVKDMGVKTCRKRYFAKWLGVIEATKSERRLEQSRQQMWHRVRTWLDE
jgi:hypothetical protein